MQFKENNKKAVGFNITSLIDVMFILLIFFMVTSSFIEQPGMELELPKTKTQDIARIENIVVNISRDGHIYVNDRQIAIDSLAAAIRKNFPAAEEKTLILKADRAAEHGTVVEVMDIAKMAGFKKLVIGTRTDIDH